MKQNNNLIALAGKISVGKDLVGKMIQYITWRSTCDEKWIEFLDKNLEHFLTTGEIKGIQDINNYSEFQIKKFADKLKEGLEYDFPSEFNKHLWETSGREYREEIMPSLGITRRKALQLRGEKMREINEDYWVNALFADYRVECDSQHCLGSCYSGNGRCSDSWPVQSWIITDMRFPNELKAVKDRGGITIRINRPCSTCGLYDNELCSNSFHLEKSTHKSETSLDNAQFDYVIENNGSIEDLFKKVENICKQIKLV